MATKAQIALAQESVVREDHRCSPPSAASYMHYKNVKKGVERKDRHSSSGMNPSPKKAGKGGRFTWEGPQADYEYAEAFPDALDKNDPNYVDDEQEEIKEKKTLAPEAPGVPVVVAESL